MKHNDAILDLTETILGGGMVSSEGTIPDSPALRELDALNIEAELRWKEKLKVDGSLTRSLVSFQANKIGRFTDGSNTRRLSPLVL